MLIFFSLVIQLHFVLQGFWKWCVLSHAARGGLFSFPTCVGCCFYSWAIENEWFLWLVEGFSRVHSHYWTPKTERTVQKLSDMNNSLKEKSGYFLSLLVTFHHCSPKDRPGIRFCHVSCGSSQDSSHNVPMYHISSNLISRKEFVLWGKGSFTSYSPWTHLVPWWGRAIFKAIVASAATHWIPLCACSTVLQSPGQLGISVTIPQISKLLEELVNLLEVSRFAQGREAWKFTAGL